MFLTIAPEEGYEQQVLAFYKNHGTFHKGDAGLDLFCLEDITIPPNSHSTKTTLGIKVQPSSSFYLYPRSSTGSKTPIRLSNGVGIIDSTYRGPIIAYVDNISSEAFTMKKGERYFQICSPDLSPIEFTLGEKLTETTRGEGGFGSTNKISQPCSY